MRVWSDQSSVVLATPVCVFCNVRYILFRLPFVSSRRSQPLSYTHRSPLDVVDISGQVLDLYDVAHVTRWEPHNLHSFARVSWVGSVITRSCRTSHFGRLGSISDLDIDLFDVYFLTTVFRLHPNRQILVSTFLLKPHEKARQLREQHEK